MQAPLPLLTLEVYLTEAEAKKAGRLMGRIPSAWMRLGTMATLLAAPISMIWFLNQIFATPPGVSENAFLLHSGPYLLAVSAFPLLLILGIITLRTTRKRFALRSGRQSVYRIDDQGLWACKGGHCIWISWDMFETVLEDNEMFVLRSYNQWGYCFPRRCFLSVVQQSMFRDLAHFKISRSASANIPLPLDLTKLPQPAYFPPQDGVETKIVQT